MELMKDAFIKAYTEKLLGIRELYSRGNIYHTLRYRVGFLIYMLSTQKDIMPVIEEADRIIDTHNKRMKTVYFRR